MTKRRPTAAVDDDDGLAISCEAERLDLEFQALLSRERPRCGIRTESGTDSPRPFDVPVTLRQTGYGGIN